MDLIVINGVSMSSKYQTSYPDSILLPAIRKSIVGKAKSVIRHLGPSYTVDEVITVLT